MANHTWDLSVFFKDEAEFLSTLDEFNALIPTLASFEGKLHDLTALAKFLRLDKTSLMPKTS